MSKSDTGHDNLVRDVQSLLDEIGEYQFHDFKNVKYPAPKVALVGKLNQLILQVKSGRYDN